MSVQTDYYIPQLKKADEQISLQATEIRRQRDLLDSIDGHLHLLKAAIKAGDPHDELKFRVEEIERAIQMATTSP